MKMRPNQVSRLRKQVVAMRAKQFGICDIAWALNVSRCFVRQQLREHRDEMDRQHIRNVLKAMGG